MQLDYTLVRTHKHRKAQNAQSYATKLKLPLGHYPYMRTFKVTLVPTLRTPVTLRSSYSEIGLLLAAGETADDVEQCLLGDWKPTIISGEPIARFFGDTRGEDGAASLWTAAPAFKLATIEGHRDATFRHQSFDEPALVLAVSAKLAFDVSTVSEEASTAGISSALELSFDFKAASGVASTPAFAVTRLTSDDVQEGNLEGVGELPISAASATFVDPTAVDRLVSTGSATSVVKVRSGNAAGRDT